MFEGMTVDEVRAELKKSMPPMDREPMETTLRRLGRWAAEIGLDAEPQLNTTPTKSPEEDR